MGSRDTLTAGRLKDPEAVLILTTCNMLLVPGDTSEILPSFRIKGGALGSCKITISPSLRLS